MTEIAKITHRRPATIQEREQLAVLADRIRRDVYRLDKNWGCGEKADDPIKARAALHDWVASGGRDVAQRADKLLTACDNPNYTDENGEPRPAEISKALAAMLGSFPTCNIPEPKVYTRALLEDVIAGRPYWLELESTCRRIRRTQKFVPSISEVLEVLKEESALWRKRYEAIDVAMFYASLDLESLEPRGQADRQLFHAMADVCTVEVRSTTEH